MKQAIWGQILRTAITGTERTPLPASVSDTLGIPVAEEPSQAVLESLTHVSLLRKAGLKFEVRNLKFEAQPTLEPPTSNFELPTSNFLPLILNGRYAPLLDEWLALLTQHRLELPPEYLPELLDRSVRDPDFWEKLRPAVGARGEWLANQNPAWQHLYAADAGDWFTADFDTRLKLLAEARRNRPLITAAWLEKTWDQESNDHKIKFLETLRTGLSLFDESLLNRAMHAKSRDVRFAAATLLATLPECQHCIGWTALAQRWSKFAKTGDLPTFLDKTLPDIEAQPAAALFALTDGKGLRSARQSILQTLLRLLPPAVWEVGFPFNLLTDLQDDPERDFALPALLEATARHHDPDWTTSWLKFLQKYPQHALWRSAHLLKLLSELDREARQSGLAPLVIEQFRTLSNHDSVLYRMLADDEHLWPASLMNAVLVVWTDGARQPFSYPNAQLRAVLDNAALRCSPADAEAARSRLEYVAPDERFQLPAAWQQGWDAFFDVVRFRQRMAVAF